MSAEVLAFQRYHARAELPQFVKRLGLLLCRYCWWYPQLLRVTLGLRTTLGLEALLLGEVEVNVSGGVGVDTVNLARDSSLPAVPCTS
jgi:hypothetical protein